MMSKPEAELLNKQNWSMIGCVVGVALGACLFALLWGAWDGPFRPGLPFNPHKMLGWSGGLSLCAGVFFGFRWHILKAKHHEQYVHEFEG